MLFAVIVVARAYIYFSTAVVYDAIYRILVFRTHLPVFGKIVTYSVGDDADSNILFIFCIGEHDAVDCVVQCAVTTYNDNGAISVVGKNSRQTLYRTEPFGLHVVIRHTFAVHICFNFFPPFLYFTRSGFGVIDHSPFIGFYTHMFVPFNKSNISIFAV